MGARIIRRVEAISMPTGTSCSALVGRDVNACFVAELDPTSAGQARGGVHPSGLKNHSGKVQKAISQHGSQRLRCSRTLCQNECNMACYSGVSTIQRHGTALLESAQLLHSVHLVLDAPWGFALWGFAELPRPALVVTECPSPHYLRDLIALAPEGILATSAGPEDVLEGLREVAEGRSFHKIPALSPDSLTAREREVMRRVALGLCDADIALALGVSRRTVYNWVSSLQEKLGLKNRVQIALYYLGMLPHCQKWCSM